MKTTNAHQWDYGTFFRALIGPDEQAPLWWQEQLAGFPNCDDRLIRIPTGFGKTLGVIAAWLWHRVELADDSWPRRLIWCLPMRVLVEQTRAEIEAALRRLDLLWDSKKDHANRVGVHLLMGGADAGDWHLYPEHCAVLIGTQDMLLSRALNRGYGAARGRWPMDFGLLNQDSLWVMDEVQLMDVGLATSAQLQAFRYDDRSAGKMLRPTHTWWMSATLQRSWLEKSPDTVPLLAKLPPPTAIPPDRRTGHLWDDVRKPLRIEKVSQPNAIAALVAKAHVDSGRGAQGPTVLVVNRVTHAVDIYLALRKNGELARTDVRLVHSRFRPHERSGWREDFLNRAACVRGTDRIVVSTQVIEAGVDISAAVLVTQLAPWTSLVQRCGRAARWGGSAEVIVLDHEPRDDQEAAPYTKSELDAARVALGYLSDAAPLHLESFEEVHTDLIRGLYPYDPKHLLLRHEVEELFDTTPDLSGADLDISRFIRSGDERDLHVFWNPVDPKAQPDRNLRAPREALCAVPFLAARDWLCGKETKSIRHPRLMKGMRAWVWDWLSGRWRIAERRDLYPGQTVLVSSECGGYDTEIGWSPVTRALVEPLPEPTRSPDERADSSEDNEALSSYPWQTIGVHGLAVGSLASEIASELVPAHAALFQLAGRWHDAGKVHPVFQASIVGAGRPQRRDLAKAPKEAWLPLAKLYPDSDHGGRRRGFRHELASTLALFGVLQRHKPEHPALLGPWMSLLEAAGTPGIVLPQSERTTPLDDEILALNADEFDLLAYLVCAHHGKVRGAWHASPADQEAADDRLRIRGMRDGENLPAVLLSSADGQFVPLPAALLNLATASIGLNPHTGRGWTERVLNLVERHGPFALAWMEAILRAADQRASRQSGFDPLLAEGGVD